MAANVETAATIGEVSWHGEENNLPADHPSRFNVHDFVHECGLDWSVSKETIKAHFDGMEVVIEDKHAIRRSSDNKILGVVGDRYECLQNTKAFEWFQPFLDTGEVAFETGGSLKGGTTIWALTRILGDSPEVSQGDKINEFLLLTSSHDGSNKTRAGFCPIRVVCWNTLQMAKQDSLSKLLSVKHTKNQTVALDSIRETINVCRRSFEATVDQYKQLLKTSLNEDELRAYVQVVLNGNKKDVSTRMENIINTVVDLSKNGKGQSGELNLWSAYNGVTEYLSHEVGRNQDNRQTSLWYGQGYKVNQSALELAVEMAV